jgi:riboflavin synthase, alpha subunit
MFTGIVAAVGRIVRMTPVEDGARVEIDSATLALDDVAIGDSIAVNGVCLTVVTRGAGGFAVDVSGETLACTIGFGAGEAVNLEKALRLADRLGGHLVSGHVDGVGEILAIVPAGESRIVTIAVPPDLARYVARKGSIAVNGVSLTVNEVDGRRFSVNLIPHTLAATTLHRLAAGARVNVEVDMLARYVERMLQSDRKA